MGKLDAMSRRHNLNGGENDNVDVTVLSPCHFRNLNLCIQQGEVLVEGPETSWYDQIKSLTATQMEPEVLKAIAQKQPGVLTLNNGRITWQGKLYVPEIPKL